MDTQESQMKHCLVLAKEALSKAKPPVKAVIVQDGSIIAKGQLAKPKARCIKQLQNQQQ